MTLDRTAPGPDHAASLEPEQFRAMVDAVRTVEIAIGDGVKAPRPSELANMAIARKSLVAARDISAGQRLTADDIACKRAGLGRPPIEYWELVGTSAPAQRKREELL